jgi:hypothetical protein
MASAQAPDSLLAVELTVAAHLREAPGFRSPVALDPVQWNLHSPRGRGAVRDSAQTQALAGALGAPVRTISEVLSCPSGPASCSLGEFAAHLIFGRASILGDSATVEVVRHWWTGSPSSPVAYSRAEYGLHRTPEGWRVVGRRGKVIS